MKKRLFLLAALAAGSALAHHGWSEYQSDKPLDLTGTIEQAGYEQPHGFVRLKTADKTWLVVLAPPPHRRDGAGATGGGVTGGADGAGLGAGATAAGGVVTEGAEGVAEVLTTETVFG